MRHLLAAVALAVLAAASRPALAATLYDDLGGKPAIARFSDAAIDLYMRDPRLKTYFDNINPDWLKPRFIDFVCKVTGGPCLYHGRSMTDSHRGLHVDEAAFDAVVEDLQVAMRQSDIPFHLQNRLLARLAPMERDIVTR